MKRLFLSVLIAFSGAAVNYAVAQPTLTAISNPLHIGGQTYVSTLTLGAMEFATGTPAGANQTWTFANLPSSGTHLAEVLSRAAAPKPTDYPAANLVVKIGSEYAYIEDNNGILKEHAAYESTQNYSLENTDPAEKMRFPFTFNDTYSDNFAGAVNLAGNVIPRIGVVTVTAEGYGTLVTPLFTHTNVLKVKTEEVANPLSLFSENTITYDWYIQGNPLPLLRMTRRITMAGTMYTGYLNHVTVWGTKEELATQLEMQVFPNPASNLSQATLEFSLKKAEAVNISLVNLVGQEVCSLKSGISSAGKQSLAIPVGDLPKGVYFISLALQDQVAIRRLVVQ